MFSTRENYPIKSKEGKFFSLEIHLKIKPCENFSSNKILFHHKLIIFKTNTYAFIFNNSKGVSLLRCPFFIPY